MQVGGDFAEPCGSDLATTGLKWREPFANLMQTGSLVFLDSGRSAIRFALRSLRLHTGATVLTPAYICDTVIAASDHRYDEHTMVKIAAVVKNLVET